MYRLVAGAVALALTCGCKTQTRPSTPPDGPITVTIAYAEPQFSRGENVGFAVLLSFLSDARLVTMAPDGRVGPGLAERWEVSPDGRTWRFHLKPNLRFHDGQPLTAREVRRGLLRNLQGSETFPGLRDVARVEAPHATELVLRLNAPSWLLLEALAIQAVSGGNGAKSRAGPFLLERQEDTEATLRAFDGYFRGPPTVDRVRVRVYPRPRRAWAALLRGEVDFLYEVAPEAVGFLEQAHQVQIQSFLRPYVYVLGFNLRHPVLRHREVRLALNYAVDRQAIIDQVLAQSGVPASGHIAPGHWAADERITPFPYDPSRAATLLAEAGTTQAAFTCLVPAGYPRTEHLALLLQRQLIEAGVDMAIEVVPLNELFPRLATGRFDAYLLEMGGRDLNYPYWSWHSGNENGRPLVDSGYTAADAVLDKLRYARDEGTAASAVREFQRTLRDDPPAAFLCWSRSARALSSRFALPDVPPNGDVLGTIASWRLAEDASAPDASRVAAAGSP